MENDPDIVAMIGTSAALCISGLPFMGPIGGARVGYRDGDYLLNPSVDDLAGSQLDLVVAGTKEGVLMVESQAQELPEDVMLGAVTFGHEQMQPVIDMIVSMAEACAKEPREPSAPGRRPGCAEETHCQGGRIEPAGGLWRNRQTGPPGKNRCGQVSDCYGP